MTQRIILLISWLFLAPLVRPPIANPSEVQPLIPTSPAVACPVSCTIPWKPPLPPWPLSRLPLAGRDLGKVPEAQQDDARDKR